MGTGICLWPDQNLSNRLIKELVQGRDLATQLQILLHKPFGENGSASSAGELAGKILQSFTESLSVLLSSTSTSSDLHKNNKDPDMININIGGEVVSDQINVPEASIVDQSQCGDRSSEDSGEISTKKRPALKDRRGCYKRKTSQSWTKITTKIEDGQAWRKYGQKNILNAQYPRAYFRCTRKYDQGCRATKQVQQIQDNPKLYQTTYIGHHTCISIPNAPQMIISDCHEYPWNSASNYKVTNNIGSDHSPRSTTTSSNIIPKNHKSKSTTTKLIIEQGQDHDDDDDQVIKKETPRSDDNDNASFDTDGHDHSLWPNEFKDLELPDPSIDKDVVSHHVMFSFEDHRRGTATSDYHDLDMDDFVVKSIDFRDDFQFDEKEFPM